MNLFVAFAGQNRGLDGGTVRDGFIRVDGLAQVLAVEEVGQELLHLRDTGGTTDEDDFVDGGLVHLRVAKGLFDRVHALTEQVHAEFFEASTGDGGVEVNALEERVDFDGRLRRGRQGALRAFARRAETTERLGVAGDVLLVLALEFSDEVLQQASVEIFTTQVRVASRRLDFKDALFDGQQGHIKGTTTEIENQNVLFRTVGFVSLVQTVRDGWDMF